MKYELVNIFEYNYQKAKAEMTIRKRIYPFTTPDDIIGSRINLFINSLLACPEIYTAFKEIANNFEKLSKKERRKKKK